MRRVEKFAIEQGDGGGIIFSEVYPDISGDDTYIPRYIFEGFPDYEVFYLLLKDFYESHKTPVLRVYEEAFNAR